MDFLVRHTESNQTTLFTLHEIERIVGRSEMEEYISVGYVFSIGSDEYEIIEIL